MSLGVCAILELLASVASAQQPPAAAPAKPKRAAVLLFSGCGVEGAPPRAVSDVLSLELDAANVRLKGEDEGFGTGDLLLVVRGGCEASEPLTLRASVDGTQRERSLLLNDVPDSARARTLALSLAELGELVISGDPPQGVPPAATPTTTASPPTPEPETAVEKPVAAAQPKPEAAPKPAPPKPAPPVVPERERQQLFAEPETTESVRRSELLTASLANRWFGLDQATWGGRGRVDIAPAFFGGEALYGQAATDIGSVRGLVADGFVGVRLLSLAKTRLVSVDAGPRAGAGVVHVYGLPQGGATSSDTFEMYLDAAVVCDTRLHFAEVLSASLSVELGAARGVAALADGARVSEFGGFFMGVTLGLGFGL